MSETLKVLLKSYFLKKFEKTKSADTHKKKKTMITSMQKFNNLLKVSDFIFFHRLQNSKNGKNV